MKHFNLLSLLLFLFSNTLLLAQQFGPEIEVAPYLRAPNLYHLALADLDGDSYNDIIASGYDEMGWFRNLSGTGEFEEFRPIHRDSEAGGLQVAIDWDQDDDLDIFAISTNFSGHLYYYENLDGQGSFGLQEVVADLSGYPKSFQFADIDNDGDNDFMMVSFSGNVIWYRNEGSAINFEDALLIPSSIVVSSNFSLGDIDNDGDLDLTYGQGLSPFHPPIVHRYDAASASFLDGVVLPIIDGTRMSKVDLVDLDGDGNLDLYGFDDLDRIYIYFNADGSGTFGEYEFIIPAQDIYRMDALDVDSDGDLDLMYTSLGTYWMENINGTGVFSDEVVINSIAQIKQIVPGSLNDDNYLDFATLVNDSISWIAGSAEQMELEDESIFFNNGYFLDSGSADMNQDGKADLVSLANSGTFFEIYLDDGELNRYHYPIRVPATLKNFSLADLDQDGDIDLIGSHNGEDWVGWYENDNLNFTAHQVDDSFYNNAINPNFGSTDPAIPVDVDGDGDLDILVYNTYQHYNVGWYENMGNGLISQTINIIYDELQGALNDIHPVDIDKDGDLDFVFSAKNPNRLIFAVRSDTDNSYEFTVTNQEEEITDVEAADMDGDGDIDLVIYQPENEFIYWLENDGIGFTFEASHFMQSIFYGDYLKAIRLADLNEDGLMDIITTSTDVEVSLNQGIGNFFEDVLDVNVGWNWGNAFSLDYDRDGDLDLVTVDDYGFSFRENYHHIPYPRLMGTVYWDENGNGQFDSLERGMNGHQLSVEPFSPATWSYDEGLYQFFVASDAYQLSCIPADHWVLTTDSIVNISVSENGSDTVFTNFGLLPMVEDINAQVSISAAATRCEFSIPLWINYEVNSNQQSAGIITLELDPLVVFEFADPMPDMQTATSLSWSYSDLIPLQNERINVTLHVAGVEEVGSPVNFVASMSVIDADTVAAVDTFYYQSIITCAIDPNDKLVSPAIDNHPNYTLPQEDLFYTIRFENIGTDTAFNIFIEDQLDDNLDWSTFQLVAASHTVRTTLSEHGLLTFYFDDIHLPYTSIDAINSHGFVSYSISPTDSVREQHGQVHNEAAIFFDFNPPILTNIVQNVFVEKYPIQFETVSPSCFDSQDGTITTDYANTNYIHHWNGTIGSSLLENISGGSYTLSLYRPDGVLVADSTITLLSPQELELTFSTEPEVNYQANGSASVDISGGVTPYTTQWSTEPISESTSIDHLSFGTYQVTVTDANGCVQTGEVDVDLVVNNGLLQKQDVTFNIYPNPAKDQLKVHSTAAQAVAIAIYDINGKLVQRASCFANSTLTLNVAALPSAVYVIEITAGGHTVFKQRLTIVH